MFSELYLTKVALGDDIPSESYLSRLPVVRHLRSMGEFRFQSRVTFLVGDNGAGKSTLLEAIALCFGFNPEGGTVNYSFTTEDSHSAFYRYLTVGRGVRRPRDGFFLRAESFYNAASYLNALHREDPLALQSYGGVSLHEQSHGESFLSLVEHRFGANGLYLLDEPEAALSPLRQMSLMCRIGELVKQNCQFVICTHSPILMTFPGAEIFELSEQGIQSVSYQQTQHYQLTREFLQNPERLLRILFDGESGQDLFAHHEEENCF